MGGLKNRNNIYRLVLSGMFIAIAMLMPFLVGQLPVIAKKMSLMHIPILLCGFFCGPVYGGIVGFISPLLRSVMFGMPALMPNAVTMAFELLTYGVISGLMYKLLPKKIPFIYISLIISMIAGRIVWGCASLIILGFMKQPFGWEAFMAGAFLNAIPGIILHIVLIPILVIALRKYTVRD